MPKFSANLGFLFTELPFLDRFGAAAREKMARQFDLARQTAKLEAVYDLL